MSQICCLCESPIKNGKRQCLCRKRAKIDNSISTEVMLLGGVVARPIGIEIEAASWGDIPARDGSVCQLGTAKGKFIHDGSVTSGLEWASSPILPKEFNRNKKLTSTLIDSLLTIADQIQSNGVTFDVTCGYHVHVDARDWSYWEVTKVWQNFIQIQHWMYLLCHPEREALNVRRNRYYCNRYELALAKILRKLLKSGNSEVKKWMTQQLFLTSTEAIADSVRRHQREILAARYNATTRPTPNVGFTAKDLMAHKSFKYHNNRYYGFNIMPWHLQGTVEFRMQGYPLTTEDIVMWPLVICNITHRLLNGPMLKKEPATFEEFIAWAELPDVLKNYVQQKYNQFRQLRINTTVVPNYERLV